MEKLNLSLIIIAGNEEEMIFDCVKNASFAKELILVTTPASTKKTISLAQKANPKLIHLHISKPGIDFSLWRNAGIKKANQDWIFYLDADERVSPSLQKELEQIVSTKNPQFTNYDFPRANFFLGKRVRHGNSYPDYVKRLFLKTKFHGYSGKLHEQPKIEGPSSITKNDLLHYTHRDLTSMLEKTIKWTDLEAKLLYQNQHPPVYWWRFPRMMFTKFWERAIKEKMYKDGTVGWISIIFEMFNTFIIYARLWELQKDTPKKL